MDLQKRSFKTLLDEFDSKSLAVGQDLRSMHLRSYFSSPDIDALTGAPSSGERISGLRVIFSEELSASIVPINLSIKPEHLLAQPLENREFEEASTVPERIIRPKEGIGFKIALKRFVPTSSRLPSDGNYWSLRRSGTPSGLVDLISLTRQFHVDQPVVLCSTPLWVRSASDEELGLVPIALGDKVFFIDVNDTMSISFSTAFSWLVRDPNYKTREERVFLAQADKENARVAGEEAAVKSANLERQSCSGNNTVAQRGADYSGSNKSAHESYLQSLYQAPYEDVWEKKGRRMALDEEIAERLADYRRLEGAQLIVEQYFSIYGHPRGM